VRFACSDETGAIEDLTAAVRSLEESDAYPTLRLAGAHAALLMGDTSGRPQEVRRSARRALQWLRDADASERRIELLVERLTAAG